MAICAAAAREPGGVQAHGDATDASSTPSDFKLEALMPEYATEHEEAYLCTSVPLPDRPLKLVGVEPLSKQEVVHHMLLFGARHFRADFILRCSECTQLLLA